MSVALVDLMALAMQVNRYLHQAVCRQVETPDDSPISEHNYWPDSHYKLK